MWWQKHRRLWQIHCKEDRGTVPPGWRCCQYCVQYRKKCWHHELLLQSSGVFSSKYPTHRSNGSNAASTEFIFLSRWLGKAQDIHVKNASQVHCHQCHEHFRSYFPKATNLLCLVQMEKKNMPGWVPLLFDGLTSPRHSVNLLQGQLRGLEELCVAWKTSQENETGDTFKRNG